MTKHDLPRIVTDPDGRNVEFTEESWRHVIVDRPSRPNDVDEILAAVADPDFREDDPILGRERFYRRQITDKVRWLRVIVDFNQEAAFVVTAFVQRKDPTRQR
jgi:hypothetical protein